MTNLSCLTRFNLPNTIPVSAPLGKCRLMLSFLRQIISDHRTLIPFRVAASASEKYLRAYYNQNVYNAKRNGEWRVISLFASNVHQLNNSPPIVLDVGANKGNWSDYLLSRLPNTQLYAFEIVSDIRHRLRARFEGRENVHIMDFGLSASGGTVDVSYNISIDDASAISPCTESPLFHNNDIKIVTEYIKSGDEFVQKYGLSHIDFIKIDVEGHEVEVLKGFANTLAGSTSPRIIQFEYGETYLSAPHTLREVYQLLTPHGYAIGRIFPRQVVFKDYEPSDDHFRLGNYIAVKKSDALLRVFQ